MTAPADGTLEQLMRQLKREGYRVHNLFDRGDFLWQANVRSADGAHFYEFGRGPDAYTALEAALVKAKSQRPAKTKLPNNPDERTVAEPDLADDEDDLIG